MKKQLTTKALTLLTKTFALSLLVAVSAGANDASAQTARPYTVSVPFEFVVGEERLPAGDYTVRRALRDSESTLMIRSADGGKTVTVHTSAAGARETSSGRVRLVFRRHGEQHFLRQISTPESQTARAFPVSRIQRSLERELAEKARQAGGTEAAAKASAAGETVTINAGLR